MNPLPPAPSKAARASSQQHAPRRPLRLTMIRGAGLGCSLLLALGACSSDGGTISTTSTPSATIAATAVETGGPDSTSAPSDAPAAPLSTVQPGEGYICDGESTDGSDASGGCRRQTAGPAPEEATGAPAPSPTGDDAPGE